MKTIFRPSSGTALAFGFCLGVAHAAPRLAPDKFVVLQLRQDEAFVIAVDSHPRAGQVSASDTYGARSQIDAVPRRYAYSLFGAGNGGETANATSDRKPHGSRRPGE